MKVYRYQLEKGSKQFVCPACGKKRYKRYIDNESGHYLPEQYGRCNRADNCNYHSAPPKPQTYYLISFRSLQRTKKAYRATAENGAIHFIPFSQVSECIGNDCYISDWFLNASNIRYDTTVSKEIIPDSICNTVIQSPKEMQPPSYHSLELLELLYCSSVDCNLTDYLNSIFDPEEVFKARQRYLLTGTNKRREKSTIYWRIDDQERIHSGKVMLYDPTTGKRAKDYFNWVHKIENEPNFVISHCLFGLHLVKEDIDKRIAITESEKSAVIMSTVLPEFIWMACGGKGMFKKDLLTPLQGRSVIYYPDKGLYKKSVAITAEMQSTGLDITVSNLIEELQNLQPGDDIADAYLQSIGSLK